MNTEQPKYHTYLSKNRGGPENSLFIDKNPVLEEIFRTDAGNDNQENSFTLEQLTEHGSILMPYIDYIWAVIDLYSYLCLDGNITSNIDSIMRSGMSFTHAISVIKSNKIHIKFRKSYAFLLRVLFLDIDPFLSIIKDNNRWFFWESLEFKPAETMTVWDRPKIEVTIS